MADEAHHEHLIKEVEDLFENVLTKSPQGIYIYLDDTHKTCNEKLASMLGYSSPREWIENEFPVGDIAEEDQERGIKAYVDASKNFKASSVPATWKTKDGKELKTEVIVVPFEYKDEVFVIHFIS